MKRKVFLFALMMLFSFTASAQKYVKNWEKQAKTGDKEAQVKLEKWYIREGNMYKLLDEYKKSLKWYRKAAELGNADACYEVAMLWVKGISKDDPYMWLLRAAMNGNDEMKVKVVNQLSTSNFNLSDKYCETLLSIAEYGNEDIKMKVVDGLVSSGETSKAILLLKSWAEQSTSLNWTERIIRKITSLGDIELIHQPKIQEQFCIHAKELFERKDYQNAYTSLSLVIDETDSPAKSLLSELKNREDSLAHHFSYGAWFDGPVKDGVVDGNGVLTIPFEGQDIIVEALMRRGEPQSGVIKAFGINFSLRNEASDGLVIKLKDKDFTIVKSNGKSIEDLIKLIVDNVEGLKVAERDYALKKEMDKSHEEYVFNKKETERKREEAESKKILKEYEQWKKTHYHSTPKEVRCMYCGGFGYKDVKDYDYTLHAWVKERQRCIYCYGRGYTLEHYY